MLAAPALAARAARSLALARSSSRIARPRRARPGMRPAPALTCATGTIDSSLVPLRAARSRPRRPCCAFELFDGHGTRSAFATRSTSTSTNLDTVLFRADPTDVQGAHCRTSFLDLDQLERHFGSRSSVVAVTSGFAHAYTALHALALPSSPLVMRHRAAGENAMRTTDEAPLVIELFTSQGCSSCPPAECCCSASSPPAGQSESRPIVALSFHVDYWNDLGWADPFSTPGVDPTPTAVRAGARRRPGLPHARSS